MDENIYERKALKGMKILNWEFLKKFKGKFDIKNYAVVGGIFKVYLIIIFMAAFFRN